MSDEAEKRTGLKRSGIFTKVYWFRSSSLPEGSPPEPGSGLSFPS